MRFAMIRGREGTLGVRVAVYLPRGYEILAEGVDADEIPPLAAWVLIGGEDDAGWTLEGYVLPRLASGAIYGVEVELVANNTES